MSECDDTCVTDLREQVTSAGAETSQEIADPHDIEFNS